MTDTALLATALLSLAAMLVVVAVLLLALPRPYRHRPPPRVASFGRHRVWRGME